MLRPGRQSGQSKIAVGVGRDGAPALHMRDRGAHQRLGHTELCLVRIQNAPAQAGFRLGVGRRHGELDGGRAGLLPIRGRKGDLMHADLRVVRLEEEDTGGGIEGGIREQGQWRRTVDDLFLAGIVDGQKEGDAAA